MDNCSLIPACPLKGNSGSDSQLFFPFLSSGLINTDVRNQLGGVKWTRTYSTRGNRRKGA